MILWVFDNDGTLYRDFGAGEQFQTIFNRYISEELDIPKSEVDERIKHLKTKYSTDFSLVAVMKEFNVNFSEVVERTYLKIDLDACDVPESDDQKAEVLSRLPGKKVVFTNNPSEYANFVLNRMGLRKYFSDVIGMEEVGFILKPRIYAYKYLQKQHQGYSRIIFCDDRRENLDTAKALGWETALATYINPVHKVVVGHLQLDSFEGLLTLV